MRVEVANAAHLANRALVRALEPPPPVDYLKWAEENIVFSKRESRFDGRYDRERFAYFDEVLRALSPEDPCRIVTVMGSAQIGKTVVGNIFVGGSMAMDPRDFLVTQPTEDNAGRWSKLKLMPMIRGTPVLAALFPEKSREGGNSVLFKERVDGLGAILISGANSPASLAQVTMGRQMQDDIAKWEMNAAGDPEAQADSRSRSDQFAKLLKISTPLVLPGCRITKSFEQGSQEYPYIPCPHCGEWQVLEWENLQANIDPDNPQDAYFTCQHCGCEIREIHRKEFVKRIEWRARNPSAARYHRSFSIWSAYSCLQDWELIVREWLRAKGDPAAEKTFLNDSVGLAYRAQSQARPWEELRDRAKESHYVRGTIPTGALLVMLGIDCQADRVEWQLVGFGKEYRRFVIEYGVIANHISDVDCQRHLDLLLQRKWKNAVGRELGIDLTAIDGNAYTEDVWVWARRHPASKLIMVRGHNVDTAPRLARVRKERNERTGNLLKYSKRFYNLGVSVLKMALYRDLGKDDPLTNGFVHFPSGLDDEFYQELTAERREPVKRHGFTVYRWVKDDRQDNEALDTMIQATGAAIKYGVYGFSDVSWVQLEAERESPVKPVQGDLEDLIAKPPQRRKETPPPLPDPPPPAANAELQRPRDAVTPSDWLKTPIRWLP
jgi:phage terminase large subunit GpA-like protein